MPKKLSAVVVLILTVFLLPMMNMPLASPAADDLYIQDIQPVQVVWNEKGLVANKSTTICTLIKSTFSARVWVDINVTYNFGKEMYLETGPYHNGTPVDYGDNTIYIPGGPAVNAFPTTWAFAGLPEPFRWTETGEDSQIKIVLDPLDKIAESDETNNQYVHEQIQVYKSRPLKILWVPVVPSGTLKTADILGSMAYLRDIFPFAWDTLSWTLGDPVEDRFKQDMICNLDYADQYYEQVAKNLSIQARVLGYDRVAIAYKYGIFGGIAIGMFREPEDRVPVCVQIDAIEIDDLLAHELGHTFYLWHPFDIGPPVFDATIYEPMRRVYNHSANNFMDYATSPVWIDKGRYDSDPKTWKDLGGTGVWQWNLFDQITQPEFRIPTILISGWILANGTLTTDRFWYHSAEGIPDLPPQSGSPQEDNYTCFMLNNNKQTITQVSFNASFSYFFDNGTLIKKETDRVPFVLNLPFPDGTRFIQIRNSSGQTLIERIVSQNSPTVNITYPNGRETLTIGENCTIGWTAKDLDGDELSYILSYSRNAGETWIPLANLVNHTSFIWNTSSLIAGNEYLVRVTATDGVNLGEDISQETFTVSDTTPPVISNVTQTPSQDLVMPDQNVTVQAVVYDINSGIRNVTFSYRYSSDNGASWSEWTNSLMTGENETVFASTMSVFPNGTTVQYRIIAYDNSLNTAVDDKNGQYYIYTVVLEFQDFAFPFLVLLVLSSFFVTIKSKRLRARKQ